MDENHYQARADRSLWRVLLMAAIAYFILQHLIIKHEGADSLIRRAIGSN